MRTANSRHAATANDRIGQRAGAENNDAAAIGTQEAGDHAQSGGFARPVGTEADVELTRMDAQVQGIHRRAGEGFR